eukprot:4610275-Amphidinium_carterae.1
MALRVRVARSLRSSHVTMMCPGSAVEISTQSPNPSIVQSWTSLPPLVPFLSASHNFAPSAPQW